MENLIINIFAFFFFLLSSCCHPTHLLQLLASTLSLKKENFKGWRRWGRKRKKKTEKTYSGNYSNLLTGCFQYDRQILFQFNPKCDDWSICCIESSIAWFLFPSLSFSRSQVVNFLKWIHHYLSENISIFHPNDDLFTQYLFFNKKNVSFDDFFITTWERERERKKEPQILRLSHVQKKIL